MTTVFPLQLLDLRSIKLDYIGIAVARAAFDGPLGSDFIAFPESVTELRLSTDVYLDQCSSSTEISLVRRESRGGVAPAARISHPIRSNIWKWRDEVFRRKQALLVVVPLLLYAGVSPKEYLTSGRIAEIGLIHRQPHGSGCGYSRSSSPLA